MVYLIVVIAIAVHIIPLLAELLLHTCTGLRHPPLPFLAGTIITKGIEEALTRFVHRICEPLKTSLHF